MTKVRVSNEPHKVVDLEDAEIADLRNLGMGVEEVKDEATDSAPAEKDSSSKAKGK